MKSYLSLIALASFAVAGVAHAHAHLEKSQPANNSTVSVAPKKLMLEFNEPVQVTALTLQKGEEAAQPLGPLPKEVAQQITVTMPALTAGSYVVKWRAVSDDSHIMSGKLLFTVGAGDTAKKTP